MLAAVSEVVKTKEGSDTETEYFGALVSLFFCLVCTAVSDFVLHF